MINQPLLNLDITSLDLHWKCTFTDLRDVNKKPRPFKSLSHLFENISNKLCFSQDQKWHITLTDNDVKFKRVNPNRHSSIISEIAGYVHDCIRKLAFFIPSRILRITAHSLDKSYIKTRNEFILKAVQNRQLGLECAPQRRLIEPIPRVFQEGPKNEKSSKFQLLAQDMHLMALSFLSRKDTYQFAYTCKQNHLLAVKSSSQPANQWREYPDLIVRALGVDRLRDLPFLQFPERSLMSFFRTYQDIESQFNYDLEASAHTEFNKEIGREFVRLRGNLQQAPFAFMGNHSLCKIQLPDGPAQDKPALIVRLKDNIINQEGALLITKNHGKWVVLTTSFLPQAMFYFLNDIRFEDPIVLDYLQRLFKGEPCGKFPTNPNRNLVGNLTYPRDRFSPVLLEGPLLCTDGQTPVLELWKPA